MKHETLEITLKLDAHHFPPSFAIEITNTTEHLFRVWPDTFPDGYEAPILQVSNRATEVNSVITRKLKDWTVTRGNPHDIAAGQILKLNYDLSDGSWVLPAEVDLPDSDLVIRAILVYPKSSIGERFSVFSGALATEWCAVRQSTGDVGP